MQNPPGVSRGERDDERAVGRRDQGLFSFTHTTHPEATPCPSMPNLKTEVRLPLQCPPSGAERLFTDPWDMFRKEVKFYELVAKECPIRTPKAHYAKVAAGGQGTLVFEDLSLLSGAVFSDPWVSDDKLETSVSRCKNVITQLAAMHAKYWNSPRFGVSLVAVLAAASEGENPMLILFRSFRLQLSVPIP